MWGLEIEGVGSSSYGLTCGWCRTTIDRKTQVEAEQDADTLGWRMVLDQTGQAHYACPDCVSIGFHPMRFVDRRQRYI